MPIVIQSVSLEQYLLWLSSQNSPPFLPFKWSKVALPSALASQISSQRFPLILRRNYSTNSAGQHSNLRNNPYLDQVSTKIIELLSALSPVVLDFALDFLVKNRKSLIRELNLPSLFNNQLSPVFSAPLPEGFSTLYSLKGEPGIYCISSKEGEACYVGSSSDIYKRCSSHFSNSAAQVSRHPKFYPYVGKYGWNSMKVQILTLVPNYTKEFMNLNPSIQLNLRDLELLFLLTKYHLMIAEQFCIDILQPSLNCDLLVNWGGMSNKGGTDFKHSEAECLRRSLDLRGRSYSEQTKDLHRQNLLGSKATAETRAKLSLNTQGVSVCATQLGTGQTISFKTKSEAATFFECSLRTISRRCQDGKPYAFKGSHYTLHC
jgi:group I intron endonuclease